MEAMNRDDLMKRIKNFEFAAVDLNLYLDNNPTNQQAISDYNMIVKELKELKKVYEMNNGPLTNFGESPSQFPWRWVEDPWPWERGE